MQAVDRERGAHHLGRARRRRRVLDPEDVPAREEEPERHEVEEAVQLGGNEALGHAPTLRTCVAAPQGVRVERVSSSGRRTKWAILVAWAVLLAIFGPLGLKLPELTNDEIVLPVELGDRRGAPDRRSALPGRRPEAGPARLPPSRRADATPTGGRSRPTRVRAAEVPLVDERRWPRSSTPVSSRRAATSRSRSSRSRRRGSSASGRRSRSCARSRRRAAASSAHVTGTPALLSDFNSAIKEADTTLLLATGLLVLAAPARRLPLADPGAAAARRRRRRLLGRLRRDLPARRGRAARRQHVHVAAARADVRRRAPTTACCSSRATGRTFAPERTSPTPSDARSRRPRRR